MINIRPAFLLAALLLTAHSPYAQNVVTGADSSLPVLHSVKDYPEGLYLSIEDFINKNAAPFNKIERRTMGSNKIDKDSILNQVFFFKDYFGGSKLKKVFAVSYQGNVYIQQRYIMDHAKKEDKGQGGDNENSYHRVINEGKFFYMEGNFFNSTAKGIGSVLGGIGGALITASAYSQKGVIFDFAKKEFDLIKDCKEFNAFLSEHNSKDSANCDKFNMVIEREMINKMIK